MPVFQGRAPGVNKYGQIDLMQWTPKVVTKAASYTVLASESGTIFVTTGATAAVDFTLPAITDGPWYYMFICGADFNMNVSSATADTLVTFNDLAADDIGYETSSMKIGGAVIAVSDATSAFGCFLTTGGHVQTVTVNS